MEKQTNNETPKSQRKVKQLAQDRIWQSSNVSISKVHIFGLHKATPHSRHIVGKKNRPDLTQFFETKRLVKGKTVIEIMGYFSLSCYNVFFVCLA